MGKIVRFKKFRALRCSNRVNAGHLEFISINENNFEQVGKIKKINLSVRYICFSGVNRIYANFLEKFPNLSEIFYSNPNNEAENNIFEIKEDKNSKINKITICNIPNGILYCHSFESLKTLRFYFNKNVKNLEKIIPLFNSNCNVKFKSLRDFFLSYYYINDEFLNLLKTNLDFIVRLDNFELVIEKKNISEICYYDFIKKILSKNINNIRINQYDVNMTKQKIKKISPNFNMFYHENISISIYKNK